MPRRLLATVVGALLLMGGAAPAFAQDAPKVGIFAAAPSTTGLVWRANQTFAVRPDVQLSRIRFTSMASGFSLDGSDFQGSFTETTTTSIGTGVSVLVTVAKLDRVRAYVVPRFEYVWLSETGESTETRRGTSTAASVETTDDSGRSFSVSGSVGAEYLLGERFSVFGEAGISRSSLKYPGRIFADSDNTSLALQSSIGVTFWF